MKQNAEIKPNKPFPFFTMGIVSLSLGMYMVVKFMFGFDKIPDEYYSYFGAPYAADIYLGQYWGVVTNNFLHIYWIHLIINLVLVFAFSSFIERRITFFRLFFLGLVVAAFSSCAQLFISDDAGIGLDGVNYGLFGFIIVRRFFDDRFHDFPIRIVAVIMIVLLNFCYYLQLVHHWEFEFVAMAAGFITGAVVGLLHVKRLFVLMLGILLSATFFCVIHFVNAPWSSDWNFAQGVKYHELGDSRMATKYYEQCLRIDPDNKLAKENLQLLHIDELSERAFQAHSNGDYMEARRLYLEILAIDKNNAWAKDNFAKLP